MAPDECRASRVWTQLGTRSGSVRQVAVLDQLDPVFVGIADEGDAAAGGAAAGAVGRLLGLDALLGEGRQGGVEVGDGDGDVVVAGAHLVGVDAVVVGQL